MSWNVSDEDLRKFRALGVKKLCINDRCIYELEFFPPDQCPLEPEAEIPTPSAGFQRRQKSIQEKKTAEQIEKERELREHQTLFASTNMVPHIPTKE